MLTQSATDPCDPTARAAASHVMVGRSPSRACRQRSPLRRSAYSCAALRSVVPVLFLIYAGPCARNRTTRDRHHFVGRDALLFLVSRSLVAGSDHRQPLPERK